MNSMSSDEFDKLFKYIESFRRDVDKNFEMVRADIRENKMAIAELAKFVIITRK